MHERSLTETALSAAKDQLRGAASYDSNHGNAHLGAGLVILSTRVPNFRQVGWFDAVMRERGLICQPSQFQTLGCGKGLPETDRRNTGIQPAIWRLSVKCSRGRPVKSRKWREFATERNRGAEGVTCWWTRWDSNHFPSDFRKPRKCGEETRTFPGEIKRRTFAANR